MTDFVGAARAFAVNFLPLVTTGISIFGGIWIIGSGVRALANASDPRSSAGGDGVWGRVGFRLLIGALLLQFSTTMNDVSELFLGSKVQGYSNVLAYMNMGGQGSSAWNAVLEVCLMWVVLLGWSAALRGFFKWNQATNGSSSGGDPFWQGLWHILGGAAAINLSGVVSGFFGS